MIVKTIVLCLALGGIGQAQAAQFEQSHVRRPVTVADAIGMTQIGDRTYLDGFTIAGNVVQFSPDKSRFAFVVQKGNLADDTVEFRLLVFRTADAFRSSRPQVVATFASTSNREAISQVKWLRDNDTITFLGEQSGKPSQLYSVSSTSRKLERLTDSPTPVIEYAMSGDGRTFVYITDVHAPPAITAEMRDQGFVITSQEWTDLYVNPDPYYDVHKQVFVKTPSLTSALSLGQFELFPDPQGTQLEMSPDGRHALINAYVKTPPSAWSDYAPKFRPTSLAAACSSGYTPFCEQQYLLIDLDKRTVAPFIDAPILQDPGGNAEIIAWTGDDSVLLVNALLPLTSVDPGERKRREGQVYAAEVNLSTKAITTFAERETPFEAGEFQQSDPARRRFVTRSYASSEIRLEFHKQGSAWKWAKLPPSAETAERLSATLDQAPNAPPRLVLKDSKRKRAAVVLDLNPQFADLAFGEVKPFHWTTKGGYPQEGLLYYPVNYVEGRKYPVVLQTHGSVRDRFWIDGPFSTAFAAQPLAGRGFFVLQMPLGDIYNKASLDEVTKILGTPEEGPYFTDMTESAIDELDREGLIDREKVGVVGFSRTLYESLYTLTHSNYHFAAAVLADGSNFGYSSCAYFLSSIGSTCEQIYGGPPYGAALSTWTKEAPTFRLDKVQAPVLLQTISAPLVEWEILAGLRWLKKPVEMENFYPEGDHVLKRPRQRLLSQGSTVDWFDFWINGHEDPDPAKAAQYERWRKLRAEKAVAGNQKAETARSPGN